MRKLADLPAARRLSDAAVVARDESQAAEGRDEDLWRLHSDAVNLAWLERRWPADAPKRVLKTDLFDEVSAPGLIPFLETRAASVIGVDISAPTLTAARSRHEQLVSAQADTRRLPFADGAFDCIVSNSTLDHFGSVEEIATSLAELHRVLRPGGTLLLTMDNRANPVVALRNALPFGLLHLLRLVPYRMGVTCTPAALQRLVRDAGFEVLESEAIMHCPRVLAVIAAGMLQRGSPAAQRRFLRSLMAWEWLGSWPTRFLSGHFIAIVGRR
jgi:SAM-dependent methyltransferase